MTEPNELASHLSRIDTLWSVVHRAHGTDSDSAGAAQEALLQRYGTAIKRYLLAALRDADTADDLFQEFALKFLNGEFKNVSQDRGRFRHYVKAVLYNLIRSHFRKAAGKTATPLDEQQTANLPASDQLQDELFLLNWREDILSRTWQALSDLEQAGKSPQFSMLRLRVQNPALSYEQLAPLLSDLTGKDTSAGSARVLIHRARGRFANLLIDLVADSLGEVNVEAIQEELAELRLLDYCRDYLQTTE